MKMEYGKENRERGREERERKIESQNRQRKRDLGKIEGRREVGRE